MLLGITTPGNSTITIDGNSFNATSTHISVSTTHDGFGMPTMGSQNWVINATVDIHDTENISYSTLSTLFDLSHTLTKDKIKDIKIEYWVDEAQQDAICVYSFRGWIASFTTTSGAGGNHLLHLTLHPALDSKQYVNVTMSN